MHLNHPPGSLLLLITFADIVVAVAPSVPSAAGIVTAVCNIPEIALLNHEAKKKDWT